MTTMNQLPALYAAEVDKEAITQAELGVTLARKGHHRSGLHGAKMQLQKAEDERDRLVLYHSQAVNMTGSGLNGPIRDSDIIARNRAVAEARFLVEHCERVHASVDPVIAKAEENLRAAIAQAHRPVLRLAIARRIEAAAAADKAAAGGDAAQAKAAASEADRIFAETWAAMDFISERHGAEMPVPLSRVPSRYTGQPAAVCSEAAERTMWGHLAPARR